MKPKASSNYKYKRPAPSNAPQVRCLYCQSEAELVGGDVIYPHLPELSTKKFWRCSPCQAWVGCHPPADGPRGGIGDGTVPLGTLANARLRRARKAAHDAFDPMFRSRSMSRVSAYAWLAREMGIRYQDTHIGLFDMDQCARVVELVRSHPNAKKFADYSNNCHRW